MNSHLHQNGQQRLDAMASVKIKEQLLKEIESHAVEEGKSITDVVEEFLLAELERRRVAIDLEEQRQLLTKYYEAVTRDKEHAEMVEDFLRASVEVMPDDEWEEYQNDRDVLPSR